MRDELLGRMMRVGQKLDEKRSGPLESEPSCSTCRASVLRIVQVLAS